MLALENMMRIDADPTKVWCPKTECKNFIQHSEPILQKTYLKCECGHEFCGHCFENWHPDITCKKAVGKLGKFFGK